MSSSSTTNNDTTASAAVGTTTSTREWLLEEENRKLRRRLSISAMSENIIEYKDVEKDKVKDIMHVEGNSLYISKLDDDRFRDRDLVVDINGTELKNLLDIDQAKSLLRDDEPNTVTVLREVPTKKATVPEEQRSDIYELPTQEMIILINSDTYDRFLQNRVSIGKVQGEFVFFGDIDSYQLDPDMVCVNDRLLSINDKSVSEFSSVDDVYNEIRNKLSNCNRNENLRLTVQRSLPKAKSMKEYSEQLRFGYRAQRGVLKQLKQSQQQKQQQQQYPPTEEPNILDVRPQQVDVSIGKAKLNLFQNTREVTSYYDERTGTQKYKFSPIVVGEENFFGKEMVCSHDEILSMNGRDISEFSSLEHLINEMSKLMFNLDLNNGVLRFEVLRRFPKAQTMEDYNRQLRFENATYNKAFKRYSTLTEEFDKLTADHSKLTADHSKLTSDHSKLTSEFRELQQKQQQQQQPQIPNREEVSSTATAPSSSQATGTTTAPTEKTTPETTPATLSTAPTEEATTTSLSTAPTEETTTAPTEETAPLPSLFGDAAAKSSTNNAPPGNPFSSLGNTFEIKQGTGPRLFGDAAAKSSTNNAPPGNPFFSLGNTFEIKQGTGPTKFGSSGAASTTTGPMAQTASLVGGGATTTFKFGSSGTVSTTTGPIVGGGATTTFKFGSSGTVSGQSNVPTSVPPPPPPPPPLRAPQPWENDLSPRKTRKRGPEEISQAPPPPPAAAAVTMNRLPSGFTLGAPQAGDSDLLSSPPPRKRGPDQERTKLADLHKKQKTTNTATAATPTTHVGDENTNLRRSCRTRKNEADGSAAAAANMGTAANTTTNETNTVTGRGHPERQQQNTTRSSTTATSNSNSASAGVADPTPNNNTNGSNGGGDDAMTDDQLIEWCKKRGKKLKGGEIKLLSCRRKPQTVTEVVQEFKGTGKFECGKPDALPIPGGFEELERRLGARWRKTDKVATTVISHMKNLMLVLDQYKTKYNIDDMATVLRECDNLVKGKRASVEGFVIILRKKLAEKDKSDEDDDDL